MNNKGFTLIELIGSIIILAMIAFILFPAVLNLVNKSNKKIDTSKKAIIESAVCNYAKNNNISDQKVTIDKNDNISKYDYICNGEYLSKDFCDSTLTDSICVNVTKTNDVYTCNIINCTE